MARQGYTGFTVQVVVNKDDEACLFVMSPKSHILPLNIREEVYDNMLEQVSEQKGDWRYWYDFNNWEGRF